MKTKMTKLYNRITEVLEKLTQSFNSSSDMPSSIIKRIISYCPWIKKLNLAVYHVGLHSLFCLDLHLPDEGYSKNDCEQIFKQFLLAQLICFLFNFICQDCFFQLQRTFQNCKFNCKTYMTSFSIFLQKIMASCSCCLVFFSHKDKNYFNLYNYKKPII